MMEMLSKGKLTLRVMATQFQSVLKLGSLNSFMSMIPGLYTFIYYIISFYSKELVLFILIICFCFLIN